MATILEVSGFFEIDETDSVLHLFPLVGGNTIAASVEDPIEAALLLVAFAGLEIETTLEDARRLKLKFKIESETSLAINSEISRVM